MGDELDDVEKLAAKAGVTVDQFNAVVDELDDMPPEERAQLIKVASVLMELADDNGVSIEVFCYGCNGVTLH
jgi:hypothetical protein